MENESSLPSSASNLWLDSKRVCVFMSGFDIRKPAELLFAEKNQKTYTVKKFITVMLQLFGNIPNQKDNGLCDNANWI